MTGAFRIHVAMAVLGGLLVVAGCTDTEKQKAIADANTAKVALAKTQAELAIVKTELAAAQKERDDLKGNVGALTTSLNGAKDELAKVAKVRDDLQKVADSIPAMKEELTQLAKDKAAAIVKATDAEKLVSDLRNQLQGLEKKVADLQETNAKLQAALDELKKKISAVTIPSLTSQ